MITARLDRLDLMEYWQEGDHNLRAKFSRPIHTQTGATSTGVVYFEVEPDQHGGSHTHSAEEIVLILEGEAEAVVGEERSRLSAGDMALIPARVPHDVYNVGEVTLRVVGFFPSAAVVTTFEEPLAPMNAKVLVMGAPTPDPQEAKAVLVDAGEAEGKGGKVRDPHPY